MYYPRFTKVIVNFFMTKDPSIPRRNRINWHFAKDDPMFTTIKVVSRHEDTQLYGAILPDELTNKAIKDSKSYKEYYAIASGAEPLKIKARAGRKKDDSDTTPKKKPAKATKGKRIKATAEVSSSRKKKQPTKGLETLSEIAISQPSGSGAHEGTGVTLRVPDVPTYHSDDEQISWKSSDEDDDDEASIRKDDNNIAYDDDDNNQDDDDDNNQDDDNDDDDEQTESENDGDDFVHPKLTTYDDEERSDEEDKEEDSFDLRVHTPSYVETTDDEETFGGNVEEEINEEVLV
ncbi:hypothetical protein Tco_0511330 [Tanacetum coccineum]